MNFEKNLAVCVVFVYYYNSVQKDKTIFRRNDKCQ